MLARAEGALLMVVDVQEKLLPHIRAPGSLVETCGRLVAGARLFGIPVLACEQYPRGLGDTAADLRARLAGDEIFPKTSFSALGDATIATRIAMLDPRQVVLCGVEAHVCVLQTALDLRAQGREVLVAADAVSSRRQANLDLGLARMRDNGVEVVCLEMLLFEWAQRSEAEQFRAVSALVR